MSIFSDAQLLFVTFLLVFSLPGMFDQIGFFFKRAPSRTTFSRPFHYYSQIMLVIALYYFLNGGSF